MRKIWVKVDPWNRDLVTTALEGGADGLLVPEGCSEKVRELGRIETISEDGDLVLGRDVVTFTITSGADEEEILKRAQTQRVILDCSDWTIIPLENLIAKGADVIAQVRSLEEAETAFGILEKGVRQILFHPADAVSLKHALTRLRAGDSRTALTTAAIEEVRPVGMGDRVCIDTCSNMQPGEGMLVGNSSGALFLVHAESLANPYVAPRPFRVNAGPVHAYTRIPGGRTCYLSELSAGDSIQIVDYQGNTVPGVVGRLKIEKRPLMLVTAAIGEKTASVLLQNAETVRLTQPDGRPVSIVTLKPGDTVLAAVEASGRHFGYKIDETITEK
jgi:3-dehydroquinate synthase II